MLASKYLTTQQTAKHFGLSKSYLEKLRLFGRGPVFYKVGRRVLYRAEDVERWFEGRRRNSTSEA